jgi:hypothetical protein
MTTPDLFQPQPVARRHDPPTSHAAAASITKAAKDHHYAIINVLWKPMTIYHIARLTGLDHVQVARRMPELAAMGKAMTTGKTAPGPAGRECRLWEKVDHA